MAISVQCPGCEKKMTAREELVGKRVKCPSCGQSVALPGADRGPEGVEQAEKPPRIMPMALAMLALFLVFGVALILAGAALKGTAAIVSGAVSLAALIAACVVGSRIQKHIIRMYPIRARMMLGLHLEPDDGQLDWVYAMTTPGALVNFFEPFNQRSRSFLLGLTQRRFLLLTTTDRLAQELAFRSIPFAEIKDARVEPCSDPYGLGMLAAKKGLTLRFELQDGTKFAVGSAYEFPAFPAHKGNLEKIASFLTSRGYRGGEGGAGA